MNAAPTSYAWSERWQHFSGAVVRFFHAYANWLVSISWKRFAVLALLLVISAAILRDLPPFSWTYTEIVYDEPMEPLQPPKQLPKRESKPDKNSSSDGVRFEVEIDNKGIRVVPQAPASGLGGTDSGMVIALPDKPENEATRDAVEALTKRMEAAIEAAQEQARVAEEEAQQAREELQQVLDSSAGPAKHTRINHVRIGDGLVQIALLWILASAIIKFTYKGRIQAETKAAEAVETAAAESLKRQVVEARMAAMQAQVEPHFLFNTLASIDHLIETDPPRASQMQRNLIALLRASMPSMREANANGNGVRELSRELAVIRPYLEILKVRMEERLQTEIDVPEGLQSAEFPPMMIQGLVENAIKHGLEPKAEGGSLKLKAEIAHGNLVVTVADTGLGFGRAATAGTGVGLANIRERLALLYGNRGSITVSENQPSGTVVTITVPYRTRNEQGA